jgi:hypothetical protein
VEVLPRAADTSLETVDMRKPINIERERVRQVEQEYVELVDEAPGH